MRRKFGQFTMGNGEVEKSVNLCWKATIIALFLCTSVLGQPPKAPEIPPVVCGTVIVTSQSEQQSFVGSVEVIRRSSVGSAIDGRVMEVLFEVGDPVGNDPENSSNVYSGQRLVQLRTGNDRH